MINGAVSLLVGLYILLVLWGGQESKLYATISEEKGFLKWAAAILTLAYLSRISGGELGKFINAFGALALMGLLLANGEKIFGEFGKITRGDRK